MAFFRQPSGLGAWFWRKRNRGTRVVSALFHRNVTAKDKTLGLKFTAWNSWAFGSLYPSTLTFTTSTPTARALGRMSGVARLRFRALVDNHATASTTPTQAYVRNRTADGSRYERVDDSGLYVPQWSNYLGVVRAGNVIHVMLSTAGITPTINDSQGNVYSSIGTSNNSGNLGAHFWAVAGADGPLTVNVAIADLGGNAYGWSAVVEIANVNGAAGVLGHAEDITGTVGPGTDVVIGTAITPSAVRSFLSSFCQDFDGVTLPTAGTGFDVIIRSTGEIFGLGNPSTVVEAKRLATAAAVSAKYSTGHSSTFRVFAAIFKERDALTLAAPATLTFSSTASLIAKPPPAVGAATLTFAGAGAIRGRAAISGTSTLTFTPSGIWTARVPIVGASSLTFAASATARATAALAGTSTLTFTPHGTGRAGGTLAGTSTLTFTGTGNRTARARMSGSTTLTFSTAASLMAKGTLSGSATLTFPSTATRTALGNMSGTSTLTFGAEGNSGGINTRSGASTLVFSTVGTLRATARDTGHATLTFTASATPRARGRLVGSTFLHFTSTAHLRGVAALHASATLTFLQHGVLRGRGRVVGAATLHFAASGAVAGRGFMSGHSTLTFTAHGVRTALARLSGTSTLRFSTHAVPHFVRAGTTTLTFTATGTLTGRGKIYGLATLDFFATGNRQAMARLVGISQIVFGESGILRDQAGIARFETSCSRAISAGAASRFAKAPLDNRLCLRAGRSNRRLKAR